MSAAACLPPPPPPSPSRSRPCAAEKENVQLDVKAATLQSRRSSLLSAPAARRRSAAAGLRSVSFAAAAEVRLIDRNPQPAAAAASRRRHSSADAGTAAAVRVAASLSSLPSPSLPQRLSQSQSQSQAQSQSPSPSPPPSPPLPPPALTAGTRAAEMELTALLPPDSSSDMELTSLLSELPALLSASLAASALPALPSEAETETEAEAQVETGSSLSPPCVTAAACDLSSWLQANGCADTEAGSEAEAAHSLELTTPAACEEQMEMTAIIGRWAARARPRPSLSSSSPSPSGLLCASPSPSPAAGPRLSTRLSVSLPCGEAAEEAALGTGRMSWTALRPQLPSSPAAAAAASPCASSLPAPASPGRSPLPPLALLTNVFHWLGLSSLDDAHLQSRLRARDSSYQQPAEAEREDDDEEEGEAAAAACSPAGLLSASQLRSCLLSAPAVEELQAACVHLLDANAQIRSSIAAQQADIAALLDDAAVAAASANPLHRLLAAMRDSGVETVLSSASEAADCLPAALLSLVPASSPLLQSVSGFFAQCLRASRLTWLRWHRQLELMRQQRMRQTQAELGNDLELLSELSRQQQLLTAVNCRLTDADEAQRRDGRAALLRLLRSNRELQQQLALSTADAASQAAAQDGLTRRLHSATSALLAAQLRQQQQAVDRQAARRLRSLLASVNSLSRCSIVAACADRLELALHPACSIRCTAAAGGAQAADGRRRYALRRLDCPAAMLSPPPLHPALSACLAAAVDSALAESGEVELAAVSGTLRRCRLLLHRALQWQHELRVVTAEGAGRVLVSCSWSALPEAETAAPLLLSLRLLSGSRQAQLVLQLSFRLTCEPRLSSSIRLHSTRLITAAAAGAAGDESQREEAELRRRLADWTTTAAAGRADGYGQLQRLLAEAHSLLNGQ